MAKRGWPDWDVYVRDGCCCVYCGFDGTSRPLWRQLVIDHLIPKNSGGSNEPWNKVVACARCNQLKYRFDPSNGNHSLLDSEPGRATLIKEAAAHIQHKESAESDDFLVMMADIRQQHSNS